MKRVHFVAVVVLLASAFALAQNPVQLAKQPNVPSIAHGLQQKLPANSSRLSRRASVSRHETRAIERTNTSQAGPSGLGLSFANAVAYSSAGYTARSIAGADFNGDGNLDLAVANACGSDSSCTSGSVDILLGNGDGTFQPAVTYPSGGYYANSVAVADLDGDGKLDVVVSNSCADNSCGHSGSTFGVLLSNGDGTFQATVVNGGGEYQADAIALADVNGDGKPDLLVAQYYGSVGVMLGNGDGTFQNEVYYYAGGYAVDSVAVGDVNGDGKPDLIVGNACTGPSCNNGGSITVLPGNGDGTFQAAYSLNSGSGDPLVLADLNGDGKLDVAETDSDSSVVVLLGNGDGTFQSSVIYRSGGFNPTAVAVADVNRDGNPDLVVANNCANSKCDTGGTISVLLGNGDGTFQAPQTFGSGGIGANWVAVGDVNGDLKPDLLVANCAGVGTCGQSAGSVGVLINTSKPATGTALTSSLNPSNFGQPVTFTATVTAPGGGIPSGNVSFYDGTTNLSTSNLNNSGVATLTTSALVGRTHSITATYNGDSNFASSTSPVLNQVVEGATASFSPTSLNFPQQPVGTTSAPQLLTLTNRGNLTLALTSVSIRGTNSSDFTETNNCPDSLAPNANCSIRITFTPTAGGSRTAAVSIVDNAPGSPQNVPLTGTAPLPDFSLTANGPTSQTVTPGQAANYTVTVSAINGFNQTVALTCGGVPDSTCTVTPGSVDLGQTGSMPVNVAVVTTGSSMGLTQPIGGPPTGTAFMAWAALIGLTGLGLIVSSVRWRRRWRLQLLYGLAFLCLLTIGLSLPGCGGTGGNRGTPASTYTLTVTASSGTLTHTANLTLVVQ